ncbi:putative selenate reductase subunit YgfK [Mixta tenebrionis]|uniref:Putative selenate reductase subunit YgfK n=1 Tax=Mixta tenebrionis TaxID=2562439 RepID=A0A506VE74_9GAMM|nr:putative selenate reductase subunit YgfK [Mixta tenebrionis]TPW43716.1 putative selenate reductase subunit YgfK [Mixta tenebrionis]
MSDIMRPVPFRELLTRICAEYEEDRAIFGIPESEFYVRHPERQITLFGETCDTALGPAAGPHTQLAPNIIVAWLTGGSFIELKTVQILDRLELEKPCIDASDEAFNTEWSTELTLDKAWDEYLKAWMALWLLETILSPRGAGQGRSFIFNMSVGYDLKGITQPPMQKFIDETIDAGKTEKFNRYRDELAQFIRQGDWQLLKKADGALLEALPGKISPQMVRSVTLSTMHGCPPNEIESICRYMLTEKNLHTYVKLNPTLLGYEKAREILDNNGFDYILLDEASFDHDLKLDQALAMLERLIALGAERELSFGVKLTNTLGTRNHKHRLPGEEMYMSGRALFPLSINVAALLSRHFNGHLPISYSGGASQFNIADIFATGIQPITMATDLLKPGGYLRLAECARILDGRTDWEWRRKTIDVGKLNTLADHALKAEWAQKEWKGKEEIDAGGPLPLTDCYVAPCVTACAIKQDIPEYLRLAGAGCYADALALIYQRNALPSITGHICDHQCQYNCTRMDYDNALNIRKVKEIVREKGWESYRKRWHKPAGSGDRHPVAVIGAGPAGLAAGYFLARAGHRVTLFERAPNAGGVVSNIIPRFRIPAELVQQDIDFIADHGVKFVYDCPTNLTVDALKRQGFHYVCIGIGAGKTNTLRLPGENPNVLRSFDFLDTFNQGKTTLRGEIAVVGAGNTAMDCARAALRINGVTGVTIVYRRERADMPAWPEEISAAEAEGVRFMTLANPERFETNGDMLIRVMKPGEPGADGRRRPVETDETRTVHFDAVITATGEQPDGDKLRAMGVPVGEDGWPVVDPQTLETPLENVFLIGDVQSGPSSIVAAIGGARKATDAILARENIASGETPAYYLNTHPLDIYARKGAIAVRQITSEAADAFARQEAERCLSCNYVCSKCVDVCPNRANVAIAVPGYRSRHQILHLDALCNECGNCAQFCPWQGKPYKDKITVFSLPQDFENSTNPGFLLDENRVHIRHQGKVWHLQLDEQQQIVDLPESLSDMATIINYTRRQHGYLLGVVEE